MPTSTAKANEQDRKERRRRVLVALFFLLLSFICLVCSSQVALLWVDRYRIPESMRSALQADYGPEISIALAPIDRDRIIADIIADEAALVGPIQTPLAGGIAIADLPDITPIIQPTPTTLIITPTPTFTVTEEAPTAEATEPVPTIPPAPSPTLAPTATTLPFPTLPPATPTVVSLPPTPTQQPPSPTPPEPTSTPIPPTPLPPTPTPEPPPDDDDDDDDDGPDNLAPIAVPDTVVMAEDDPPILISVLANDSDPDGQIITNTLKIASGPANGAATVNPATSQISYTPNPNFNGNDRLTYRICDNNNACSTTSVTITVTPVNDPPVAVDDSATTDEDVPITIDVLANDLDLDGDSLTVVSTTPPANGTVTVNPDNTITYSPGLNFNGPITFTYQISDGTTTATATVTITVTPVNDPPTAVDDTASTAEDTSQLVRVLDNDSDIDGPNPLSISVIGSPANGTAVIDLPGIRYFPNPNFSGVDTFTYTITDGALTDTATVTITVVPINDPPEAGDDNYSTPVSTTLTVPAPGVLLNDTDVDSANITVSSSTDPANGTLTINPDGSFSYTPDPAFTGVDTFTYQATDGTATSNDATVTISVP